VRRVGLFAAFLLLLGLTTATAASFDVQAEDITSFSTPVSIPVPTGQVYYLRGAPPLGSLSPELEQDTSKVFSMSLDPGGTLGTSGSTPPHMVWQTAPLTSPLRVVSPVVRLYITQTGPTGTIAAGLYDCGTGGCTIMGTASTTPTELVAVLDFESFDRTVPAGNWLQLAVVNLGTKAYNIQWGYKENRPARLEIFPVDA
jgi:hypothetical protein